MKFLWLILGVIGVGLILLITNHEQGSVLGIQNDRFASVLYMGIWAAVLSAAIIPRQGGFRAAARNAVIWLAIILALMAGYVYRYELQDIGSRLTAGLIPGSPISRTSNEGREQVMLIRSQNGHFQVNAKTNGADIGFLVDTGASSIVLTHDDAIAAGIDPDSLTYSITISTANGTTTAAPYTISTLDIGDIKRDRLKALIAKKGDLDTSLLGMSYLKTLWSFEIRGDRLVLTD